MMRSYTYVALTCVCCILIILGLWTIDISTTALLSDLIMTNGFYTMNPAVMYHIGIYLVVLCSLVLALMNLENVLQRYQLR